MLRGEQIKGNLGPVAYLAGLGAAAVLASVVLFAGVNVALENRLVLMALVGSALLGFWLLHAGLNIRRTVSLAMVLLVLAPAIRVSARLPVVFGDEILIFVVGGLLMIDIVTGHASGRRRLGLPGVLILALAPITALSMLSGYLGFGIVPSKGGMFEFVKIAQYALAFYLASQVRLKPGQLRWLSTVLVAVISISAFAGLAQVLDFPGVRSFFANTYFDAFADPYTGRPTDGMLARLSQRAVGTVGNPNNFGLILAVGLAFGVMLLSTRAFKGPKMMALLGANALMLVVLMLTGSRTATAAAVVVGLYFVVTTLQRRGVPILVAKVSSRNARVALIAMPVVAALAALNAGEVIPAYSYRIESNLDRIGNAFDVEQLPARNRIEIFQLGLKQAAESPILGYGPAEGAQRLHSSGTDNEIIFVLLRYGVVGLILYFAIWLSAFRLARSSVKLGTPETWAFGHAVTAVILIDLVATLTADSFFDIRRMTLTCLLLGLCVAARASIVSMDVGQRTANSATRGAR